MKKLRILALLICTLNMAHAAEYKYVHNCHNINKIELFEQCLDKQYAFYDGKLNGLYYSFAQNTELEQSEHMWVKFKEADCRFMSRAAQNTVNARLVYKACVLEKTKVRIDELKKSRSYGEWFRAA